MPAKIITTNGDAQVDTAQSKFGGASAYFPSQAGWIDTPDHEDFNFGSGDFTIDFWLKKNGDDIIEYVGGQLTAAGANEGFFRIQTNNTFYWLMQAGVTGYVTQSAGTLTGAGGWYHIAMVRDGNTLRLFINGVPDGTTNVTGVTFDNYTSKFSIGRSGEWGSSYFIGWIDEMRVSKGIARWTSDFSGSLPSAAYTCDSYIKLLVHADGADASTVFTDVGCAGGAVVGNGIMFAHNF